LPFGRRVINLWDVEDFGKYDLLVNWTPPKDSFETNFSKSFLLERIAGKRASSINSLLKEIDEREGFLRKLKERNIRDQKEVANAIMNYHERELTATKPISKAKSGGKSGKELRKKR